MAIAAVWVLRSREDGPDQLRHALHWSACTSVERHDDVRPRYAVRWGGIQHGSYLICQNLGPHVFYAEFHSGAARGRAVTASPPPDPYCLYASDRLVAYTDVSRSDRVRTCHDLKGELVVARGAR